MKLERKFWRLLGDYERLTRDETLAIQEQNYPVVADLSARKTVLFLEMQSLGKTLDIDRAHPALKSRIDPLIETEQRNAALLNKCVSETCCHRQTLEAATKRLRNFERVYTWEGRAQSLQGRFCEAG